MAPRLPRGTRQRPVTAGWEIELESREFFNRLAAHSGMSAGALFDSLMPHIPLDHRGRPTWLPPEPLKDGELPIDPA